jgi:hypothetical protein
VLAILCTFVAEKNTKNKLVFTLFSMIAILLPAALAGLRDTGIGTDTVTYGEEIFYIIDLGDYNFWQFWAAYKKDLLPDVEIGYLFLNYLVSVFYDSPNWLYFYANLVVVVFYYKAAYDNRKKASMWLVMFFFFFLFYNPSLNIMRQSIAVAVTLYAYKFIENKNWKWVLFWLYVVYNLHSSGIFFVILIMIFRIYELENRRISRWAQVLFVVITSICFLYFVQLIGVLSSVLAGFSKYEELYSDEGKSTIVLTSLVVYIFMLFIYRFARRFVLNKHILGYYFYSKIVGLAFFFTSLLSVTAGRVGWYVNVLDCIFMPRALHMVWLRNKRAAEMLTFLIMIIVIFVWYWTTILGGIHETSPYKSTLLGI